MGHRVIAAVSITASLLLAAAAASQAQSQLPRPGQLPPAGGQQQPSNSRSSGRNRNRRSLSRNSKPPRQAVQAGRDHRAEPMVNDPSFEAFRKQLGAIAEKKDRKALADLVSQELLLDGREGRQGRQEEARHRQSRQGDRARRQGRLRAGKCWRGFAADPTGMPFPERKDTICAPAEPAFDVKELEALAKATGTEEGDWGYPTQPGLEMRAAAQPNSPVVEKLGMHFIRVHGGRGPSRATTIRC